MKEATVAPLAGISLTCRVLVRQLLTVGRGVALAMLGVAVILVSWAVGASDSITPDEDALRVVVDLGFAVVIPIITLVFATASLGDMREDGTLVYLWLRPVHRWSVVVGACTAAFIVSLPFTVLPVTVAASLSGGGSDLIVATVIAGFIAVIAYTALFVLFGLLVKNAVVWGLAYILVWEAIAAGFGTIPARMAIRGYTRSILTGRVGIELELADVGQTAGVVVPLFIAVGAIVVGSIRLSRLDVA